MAVQPEFAYDVFISYSSRDKEWVRGPLLSGLEQAGLRAYIDFRDFQPGTPSVLEMERAALQSRHALLVLSPDYLASGWTEFEALMLQTLDPGNRHRRLVPLLKTRCDAPLRLGYLTAVDFTGGGDLTLPWKQLCAALGAPLAPQDAPEPSRAEWCLAHPYPMPPGFTGRAAETARLGEWLEGDRQHPLLVLRALGGFGKSALAWHWLVHQVRPGRWPRVVWWSFYEGDASFEAFLAETLPYLGLEVADQTGSQQVDSLLRALRNEGTLLVLDGFERALTAFRGLDAAQRGSDAGPAPHPEGERAAHEYDRERSCISLAAERFVRNLASLPDLRGKVMMTTRLRPNAVEAHGGRLLAGCREETVESLSETDAVAFLQGEGVRGDAAEIARVCAAYGHHPLSLRLLAGLVMEDLSAPGDVAAARHLDLTGELIQRRHHVLEQAYASLSPANRGLLGRLAAFRGAVAYDTLAAVTPAPEVPRVDVALRDLVRRGLVQQDRRSNRFDMHAIVRRYAYDRLQAPRRLSLHGELRDYFAATPAPAHVASEKDLSPVIELYHHTVKAGLYDEAFSLFRTRLAEPIARLAAYPLQSDLLQGLFPDGEGALPRLKPDGGARWWVLDALAQCRIIAGEPRRAIPLLRTAVGLEEGDTNKYAQWSVAQSVGLQAEVENHLGLLRSAAATLRRQIEVAEEVYLEDCSEYARTDTKPSDFFGAREIAEGHLELGLLAARRGKFADADADLMAAHEKLAPGVTAWAHCAQVALLLARAGVDVPLRCFALEGFEAGEPRAVALAAARSGLAAVTHAGEKPRQPAVKVEGQAHWLVGAACLAHGDRDAASHHLAQALGISRRSNLVRMQMDVLVDLARLHLSGGELEEAERVGRDALLLAERCESALHLADVQVLLARHALARDDRASAGAHAREALRWATCDGPPDYCYRAAYDEATALLNEARA